MTNCVMYGVTLPEGEGQEAPRLDEVAAARCNAGVRSRPPRALLYFFVFAAAIAVLVAVRFALPPAAILPPPATRPAPSVEPATEPAPPPTTKPAPPLAELLDVVRIEQPNYPTTQPLDLPADLPDAARIELSSPVYLDGVGNLWITSPKGQSIADVLEKPIISHTAIVKEQVLFVSWPTDGAKPDVFFRGGDEAIKSLLNGTAEGEAVRINPPPDWERATCFGGFTAVPSDHLISRLESSSSPRRQMAFPMIRMDDARTPIVMAQSADTLYAWQPWDNGQQGGTFALSIDAAGTMAQLTAANGWADKIIQLVPLADGSVLIVSRGEMGVELKLKPAPDPQPLTADQLTLADTLARQLGDRDPVVRTQAQRQLESLGPLIFPELERLRDHLSAEAQVRIESLLGQRFAPTLAGLRPLDGEVKTIARFRDGGCVIELTGGGTTTDGDEQTVIPAYIAIRPGKFIQRLELGSVANFDSAKYKLAAAGDEWIIVDPIAGPQRWIGSKLFPLLDAPLRDYDDLIGIDAQHRWIFRSARRPGKTLIIDPALPDITPRLPTWTINAPDGVGWTNLGWPAVKRGEKIFVLGDGGWRLPGKDETFQASLLPTDAKASSTNAPASTAPAANELHFSTTAITAISIPSGRTIRLPAGTVADFTVGNLIFAIGTENTVTRYRTDPAGNAGGDKPEAVFKDGLPHDTPRRIWLDPAGRLIFAGDQLTVTFPLGRVPKPIGDLMMRTAR